MNIVDLPVPTKKIRNFSNFNVSNVLRRRGYFSLCLILLGSLFQLRH
jgi:hypothetical protein